MTVRLASTTLLTLGLLATAGVAFASPLTSATKPSTTTPTLDLQRLNPLATVTVIEDSKAPAITRPSETVSLAPRITRASLAKAVGVAESQFVEFIPFDVAAGYASFAWGMRAKASASAVANAGEALTLDSRSVFRVWGRSLVPKHNIPAGKTLMLSCTVEILEPAPGDSSPVLTLWHRPAFKQATEITAPSVRRTDAQGNAWHEATAHLVWTTTGEYKDWSASLRVNGGWWYRPGDCVLTEISP